MRPNRDGEYYGRTREIGQSMGPFVKYLQDYEIVFQFTIRKMPKQNGVANR